jgi:FkbH-like protein
VREVNAALRAQLPAGTYFVDLEQIAGAVGRDTFYDPRNYRWTKQPFSVLGLARLAQHLWAGIRAVTTGPKKVLALDLDNTLWGGIVGEVGPLNVQLGDSPDGEAFRAFQDYARGLARRGVVLAVCSKNNARDAREPFEQNPDMVLRLDDFAAFEATWDPKPVALRRIAATLRLGLDSFVFFDDSPVEREQVRQALPDVEVVEVPPDPADYVHALEEGLWFESAALTDADRERSAQYRAEQQRREVQAGATNVTEFLTSLAMRAVVRPVDEPDMQRVVQLLSKTNQFNLTTRRHAAEDVRRLLTQEGAIGLTLRLTDRFGDYGLIAVILAVPHPQDGRGTLRVDTWLMSCRAIGRTVEEYFLNTLVAAARERGYERLVGEFVPTAKNALVADMYERFGFVPLPAEGTGVRRFVLDLAQARPLETYVQAPE